jgi:hypothetical protein
VEVLVVRLLVAVVLVADYYLEHLAQFQLARRLQLM